MGLDHVSGKNFDYRKLWIQQRMEYMAQYFGIDLLCNAILSNHVHLVLRSRPDVVGTWDDSQVAWRWSMLCPKKKNKAGSGQCSMEIQVVEDIQNSIHLGVQPS
jgi:hypothetical protein